MNKEKIWLSSPHMGGKEQEFVKEAFDTNWVAPLGPNVDGLKWIWLNLPNVNLRQH
jgi:dTDP-4-amino-4,6-dideoxygalactose transaminase